MTSFWARWRSRSRLSANIDEELAFYLEMREREFIAQGLSPDDARAAARDAFGDVREIARQCGEIQSDVSYHPPKEFVMDLFRDLRVALRSLLRTPMFLVTAVLTIALGIGPNTAIYSIFQWAFFGAPPGVSNPDDLRTIRLGVSDNSVWPWSYAEYETMRDRMESIDQLVGFESFPVHVATGVGEAERINAHVIAGDYFRTLGLTPARGRFFSFEELNTPNGYPVLVVSSRYWDRHFGTDPVASQAVTLNGQQFTIVGVAPTGFQGVPLPGDIDVWVPVMMHRAVLPGYPDDMLEGTASVFFQLMGRSVESAPVARSQAEAETIVPGLDPPRVRIRGNRTVTVLSGAAQFSWFENQLREMYHLMTAVVGLVLLIACANLMNLMLARAAARRRETAVRVALGVSRGRLVRHSVLEAGIITTGGAAIGLLMAQWTVSLFEGSALLNRLPPIQDVPFDGHVFAFTLLVSAMSAMLVGIVPGIVGGAQDPALELRGARGSTRTSRLTLRGILAGAQIAVSMVLLVAAGLFLRTVDNLNQIDFGFDAERVVMFSIDPGTHGYDRDRVLSFYRDLLDRLASQSEVAHAAVAWRAVFGDVAGDAALRWPGQEGDEFPYDGGLNTVTNGYFATFGLTILEGRDFLPEEVFQRDGRVVIMSKSLAEQLGGGRSVIGREVEMRYPRELFRIVGVVEDAQLNDPIESPGPMIYTPLAHAFVPTWATVHVRGAADGSPGQSAMATLRAMDPTMPVYDVATAQEMAQRRFGQQVLVATLTTFFSMLAMGLAIVGLYGVVAYGVNQRTKEIGVRMALGASATTVTRLVVRHSIGVAVVGTVVGLTFALFLNQVIANRLYGVSSSDPLTVVGSAGLLVLSAVLAAAAPARRATRVSPVNTLRVE